MPNRQKSITGAITGAGLLAGTLDGLAAAVQFYLKTGKNPVIVYQYIASAVFGKDMAYGSAWMALWGVLFHYLIATGCAALYFLVVPRVKFALKQPVIAGIVYGVMVWVLTTRILVPMTRVAQAPMKLSAVLSAIGILVVMVGIPIALSASRFYRKGK